MCRLELNAPHKENWAQCQIMQMMMATLLTYNNSNSNIGQNIQDNTATGIAKSVESCK